MMRKEPAEAHDDEHSQPSALLELSSKSSGIPGRIDSGITGAQQDEFGLPRRRRRQPCVIKEWQDWQACTVLCGGGIRQRERVTDGPYNGGTRCTEMVNDYQDCNLQNCAVDCEWNSWGAWGPCSRTCGGGNRVRQRGPLPFTNRDGGGECPEGNGHKKKTGMCNTFPCPVSCSFEAWGLWGGCSKTCDTGAKRRERTEKPALHGGEPCGGASFLDEKCNAFSCPVDCLWRQWGGWGECSRKCGGGNRLRERNYAAQAQNGGAACPGSPAEVLACNIEECPNDCKWSEWHDPGPCTKTCGGGSFKRHRARIAEMLNGGLACSGPSTEIGPCNVEPCALDCQYDEWQPFTECTSSCGGGVHTTMRNYTEAMHGGTACSDGNTTKEEECNTQSCPIITVKGAAHQQAQFQSAVLALTILTALLQH